MSKKLKDIARKDIVMYLSLSRNERLGYQLLEKYKDELNIFHIDKHQKRVYFEIEDSIKYRTLVSNDFELYNKIVSPIEKNHTEESFKNLIKNFNLFKLSKLRNQIVIKYDKNIGKYFPYNGNHRLALYFFLNPDETHLRSEYFKIR